MIHDIVEMEKKCANDPHLSFEELSDYIFTEKCTGDFLRTTARINKHVTECSECHDMYQSLLTLRRRADELTGYEADKRSLMIRVFNFFRMYESKEAVISECLRFKEWAMMWMRLKALYIQAFQMKTKTESVLVWMVLYPYISMGRRSSLGSE